MANDDMIVDVALGTSYASTDSSQRARGKTTTNILAIVTDKGEVYARGKEIHAFIPVKAREDQRDNKLSFRIIL